MLINYGPLNSHIMFREMIHKLHEVNARLNITENKEKEPKERQKQFHEFLQPSAKIYKELDKSLRTDLISRGGNLSERKDDNDN